MKLLVSGLDFGLSVSQEKAGEEMNQWRDVLQYPGEDSYRLLTKKVKGSDNHHSDSVPCFLLHPRLVDKGPSCET